MPRYREEEGRPCVDVRLPALEGLFDPRDGARLSERDLEPGLLEYLLEASEDLLSRGPPRVVFWLERPCEVKALEGPVRACLAAELERLDRHRREEVRQGYAVLFIAFTAIALSVSLSQLMSTLLTGTFGVALKETLVISGWVLLWRPVELLLYDGLPWRRQRRVLRSLAAATIDVRAGLGAA